MINPSIPLTTSQTGSGKTFSMGTGLESSVNPEHEGKFLDSDW